MKLRKTVLLIGFIALFISLNTNYALAKTATVTTDTLNLRKEASTSSTVLDLLDIGEKLEVLEEDGSWLKVKIHGVTGYVNKNYVRISEESANTKNTETAETTKKETTNSLSAETTNTSSTETTENEIATSSSTEAEEKEVSNTKATETTNTENQDIYVEEEDTEETEKTANSQSQEASISTTGQNETVQTNLINKEVTVKTESQVSILPLINASKIASIKQAEKVTIIDEVSNWCYIQTEQISGWVRKSVLNINEAEQTTNVATNSEEAQEEANTENTISNYTNQSEATNEQTSSTTTSKQTNTTSNSEANTSEQEIEETPIQEKTMYVNYSSVNIRKGPGTNYEIEDALVLNDEVTVTAEAGDWYKIKTGKVTGYIAKRLLATTMQSTSRSAEETNVGGNTEEGTQPEEQQNDEANTQTVATTSSKGQEIVDFAKQYLGCKYVYGGSGPSTFDCSGFTMYVFKNFGVNLSHSATAQSKNGSYVAKSDLQPGDLVFFKDYETMVGIGHCGIYIGDGNFIHASSGTGYCVKISTLLTGSYNTRYETARRIF